MTDRLDALMVRSYTKNGEEKRQYTRLGVAWPLANGEGYRLQLDALPVPTIYEGKVDMSILLLPPRDDNSSQSSPPRQSTPPSFDAGKDEMPF